jgi:hypothetical protein
VNIATVVYCIVSTGEITFRQQALVLLRFAFNTRLGAFITQSIEFIRSLHGSFAVDEFCSIILNKVSAIANTKHEQIDSDNIIADIVDAIVRCCNCPECFDELTTIVNSWPSSSYKNEVLALLRCHSSAGTFCRR